MPSISLAFPSTSAARLDVCCLAELCFANAEDFRSDRRCRDKINIITVDVFYTASAEIHVTIFCLSLLLNVLFYIWYYTVGITITLSGHIFFSFIFGLVPGGSGLCTEVRIFHPTQTFFHSSGVISGFPGPTGNHDVFSESWLFPGDTAP